MINLILRLADAMSQCVYIPGCRMWTFLHFAMGMVWNYGDLLVFRKYQGAYYNFFFLILQEYQHDNSQPWCPVMGFQNRYNQTCITISAGGETCFTQGVSIALIYWSTQTKIERRNKKQKTTIESTVLIMQICFIWTVITTDRAPQGAMADVSLWL